MPVLGFGQFIAILTGVYSAYDIIGKGNYEDLTASIRSAYENSLILRRSLEKLDNKKLDTLVLSLNSNLVDVMFDTKSSFNYLKVISKVLKPFV